MVTTRGKAATPYKTPAAKEDDQDSSDAGQKPSRAKIRKTAVKPKAKGKRKPNTVSLMSALMKLPLDLSFEIFGHLHPLDLLSIARTNKLLRSYLMSKSSLSVWKTAREAVDPPMLECPSGQSEPQWANLLLASDCMMCGTPRAKRVDWQLRLRGCERCFKANLILKTTAAKRFPNIDDLDTVLDVLPYTNTGGWTKGRASENKYYYAAAIEKMSAVIEEYFLQIDAGAPNAKKELDDFIERRQAELEAIIKYAEVCEDWAEDRVDNKRLKKIALLDQRRADILERLKALGHEEHDVNQIAAMQTNVTTQLTNDSWNKIRVQCEADAIEKKKERVRRERRDIFLSRRHVAEKLVAEYSKSQNIRGYGLFPAWYIITDWSVFRDVYEREDDDPATNQDYAAAMEALPGLCEEYVFTKKKQLLEILLAGGNFRARVDKTAKTSSEFKTLELVTSGFYCPRGETMVFADHCLGEHACYFFYAGNSVMSDWNFKCLRHEAFTSIAAANVVEAAGLDPNEATTDHMDDLNARFYCLGCPDAPKLARSWRNCVVHVIKGHKDAPPRWKILNSKARDQAVKQENENKDDLAKRFLCNNCGFPPTNLPGVLAHVVSEHGNDPTPKDYYVDNTIPPTPVVLMV